jgi:hypothetical protein
LPISPLFRLQTPTENAQLAFEMANLIHCFARLKLRMQIGKWRVCGLPSSFGIRNFAFALGSAGGRRSVGATSL